MIVVVIIIILYLFIGLVTWFPAKYLHNRKAKWIDLWEYPEAICWIYFYPFLILGYGIYYLAKKIGAILIAAIVLTETHKEGKW